MLRLVHSAPAPAVETRQPEHIGLCELARDYLATKGARLRELVMRPNFTAATFEGGGKRYRVLVTEESSPPAPAGDSGGSGVPDGSGAAATSSNEFPRNDPPSADGGGPACFHHGRGAAAEIIGKAP